MTVEYKIVDGKYVEGYFLNIDELVRVITEFQTSDPLDAKHLNIKQEIEKYLSHD